MTVATVPRGLPGDSAAWDVLAAKATAVRAVLAGLGGAVVAFSGGVDSSVVAALAVEMLGERALACTIVSGLLPDEEIREAEAIAAALGIRHRLVPLDVLALPAFVENPPDRCYHCKALVLATLREVADAEGLEAVLHGENADDGAVYRPGARAAEEAGAIAPLARAGITKAEVRALARDLGLPNADRPSAPCLATRIPYGEPVTVERMRRIGAAEAVLRGAGFGVVRVRDHGPIARIEVPLADLPRLLAPGFREQVSAEVRAAGYAHVTIDLDGYRSGSFDLARAASGTGGGDG
ncbi:MAG TPA: ATP-dependent sacrificial sulfur transferase LarE [Candidatus Limnocylindrales bacterium]